MDIFKNKSAVVTGAASGIGHALCLELARRGAKVYAADLNPTGLERLGQQAGAAIHPVTLDVGDEIAVQALLQRVVVECGSLDYLFNNAGIVVGGDFEHMTMAAWRRIVDVNLWGVIHGSQHGYRLMLKQGGGHIVNTASTAGVMPVARSSAYAATKHAVVGLSTSLREEGRRHGIRVSVVVPGLVDTGIFGSATNLQGHDYSRAIDRLPLRKLPPQQAAAAILDGVRRNRQYIVFPGYNRLLVDLHRWLPGPMGWLINRQT